VNVTIEIPDDVGRARTAWGTGVTRAVLEAVALESYRSGAITPAQVQESLVSAHVGKRNRFFAAWKRITTTQWMTWIGTSRPFATVPGYDRRQRPEINLN
jgi:hypothetical protein